MRAIIPLLIAPMLAAEVSVFECSVPDAERLRKHAGQSIYGTLWDDPGFAPIQTNARFFIRLASALFKIDLGHWHRALVRGGFVVLPSADGEANLRQAMVADVGLEAPALFAAWFSQAAPGTSRVVVAGSDDAIREPASGAAQVVARIGSVIARFDEGAPVPTWRPEPRASDLMVRMNASAVAARLDDIIQGRKPDGNEPVTRDHSYITGDLSLTSEGFQERIYIEAPSRWLMPADRTAFDRLPANTLAALVVGVDGERLWEVIRGPLLKTYARATDADDAEATINRRLADLGIASDLAGLIQCLSGTITLFVVEADPHPAIAIDLPRNRLIDQFINALVPHMGAEAPAPGTSSRVLFPQRPVEAVLACDPSRWLISSDAAIATAWLSKEDDKWTSSRAVARAVEHALPGAVLIGASDTPSVARLLAPYVLRAYSHVGEDVKQAIHRSCERLASLANTGYLVGHLRDDGSVDIESRGVLGPAILPLVGTGIFLAWTVYREDPPSR